MAPPVQPEQPWQLTKKPHEWQEVMLQARQMLHANPQDLDALEAIEDANDALSVYDEAEADTGLSRLSGGAQGAVGVVESGLDMLKGLKNLPGAAIRGVKFLARDPEGAAEYVDQGLVNTMDRLREVVMNPVRTLEEMTPREVGHSVGTAGSFALPVAKASMSVGLTSPLAQTASKVGQRTAEVANSPTVAGKVTSGLGRIARGTANAPGAMADRVGSWLDKPKYANLQAQEQAALAASRRAGVEATNQTIIPQRATQAATRSDILDQQLQRQGPLNTAAEERLNLISQQLERGGPTLENVELRNELLRLKLELQQGGSSPTPPSGFVPADEGGLFVDTPKPGFSNPKPFPDPRPDPLSGPANGISVEGPAIRPLTKADEAFSRLRQGNDPELPPTAHAGVDPIETGPNFGGQPPALLDPTAQAFNELLNISQKGKWPTLANQDIETYLRQLAAGNWPPQGKP